MEREVPLTTFKRSERLWNHVLGVCEWTVAAVRTVQAGGWFPHLRRNIGIRGEISGRRFLARLRWFRRPTSQLHRREPRHDEV